MKEIIYLLTLSCFIFLINISYGKASYCDFKEKPYSNFCKAYYLFHKNLPLGKVELEITRKVFKGLNASKSENECSEMFIDKEDWDYLFCKGRKLGLGIKYKKDSLIELEEINKNKKLSSITYAFFLINHLSSYKSKSENFNNIFNRKQHDNTEFFNKIGKLISRLDNKIFLSLLTVYDDSEDVYKRVNSISRLLKQNQFLSIVHGVSLESAEKIIKTRKILNTAENDEHPYNEPFVYFELTTSKFPSNTYKGIRFIFDLKLLDHVPFIWNDAWNGGIAFGYGTLTKDSSMNHRSINSFSGLEKFNRMIKFLMKWKRTGEIIVFGNIDLAKYFQGISITEKSQKVFQEKKQKLRNLLRKYLPEHSDIPIHHNTGLLEDFSNY